MYRILINQKLPVAHSAAIGGRQAFEMGRMANPSARLRGYAVIRRPSASRKTCAGTNGCFVVTCLVCRTVDIRTEQGPLTLLVCLLNLIGPRLGFGMPCECVAKGTILLGKCKHK